jgi:hypothetical protein
MRDCRPTFGWNCQRMPKPPTRPPSLSFSFALAEGEVVVISSSAKPRPPNASIANTGLKKCRKRYATSRKRQSNSCFSSVAPKNVRLPNTTGESPALRLCRSSPEAPEMPTSMPCPLLGLDGASKPRGAMSKLNRADGMKLPRSSISRSAALAEVVAISITKNRSARMFPPRA